MAGEALYDVFLSHSHRDAEGVEALARWLQAEAGLSVWLDRWVLVPGEEWVQAESWARAESWAEPRRLHGL